MGHPFTLRLMPGHRIDCHAVMPLEYVATIAAEPALGLHPMVVPYRLPYRGVDPNRPLRLSRFALMRRVDDGIVWETPLSPVLLQCYAPALGPMWTRLSLAVTPQGEADALQFPLADVTSCLELAACAGIVVPCDDRGESSEDTDPSLRMWSVHEAYFHARSRAGRHDGPTGAASRFRAVMAAPPGRRAQYPGPVTALARPSAAAGQPGHAGLFEVLESRRSLRGFDAGGPVTIEQLGLFLFHSARATSLSAPLSADGYEVVRHVYPTGGGMGELEVYVVAGRCAGLGSGVYHYDAVDHALTRIEAAPAPAVASVLDAARRAATLRENPQILFLISARMTRGLWKYAAIPYALALKDVGALMQTMYLVAEAMGLAPCAIGTGDSDVFAALTGCGYWEETSVGEFILGSRGTEPPADDQAGEQDRTPQHNTRPRPSG